MICTDRYNSFKNEHTGNSVVIRAHDILNDETVIIKSPAVEYLDNTIKLHITHEYELFHKVYGDDVTLKQFYGNLYIICAYDGGVSLDKLPRNKVSDLVEKLELCLKIIDEVRLVHSNGIVHRNLTPANIVVSPNNSKVRIIDFGDASLLTCEKVLNINTNREDLAYISPEQTGRTNAYVGVLSDYYSLGVIFYELLAGVLPFNYSDPLALIHAHISEKPSAILNVPEVLSDIVLKLLKKDLSDRYQTLTTLREDFERCLSEFKMCGDISYFDIAKNDISSHFRLPQKLYGVDGYKRKLTSIINSELGNKNRFVLITGDSGVGKTSLVNEFYSSLTKTGGYFVRGEFSKVDIGTPYLCFIVSIRALVKHIINKDLEQRDIWKKLFLDEIGDNLSIIATVVPEIEHIVGKLPELVKLSHSANENRFYSTILTFLSLFTRTDKHLSIFLDNSQWMDDSSLYLLEKLLLEKRISNLTVLCSYRESDEDSNSLIEPVFGKFRAKFDLCDMYEIHLDNLSLQNVEQFIADTLECYTEDISKFASVIHEKTQGNPFFLRQFMNSIYDKGLVYFDDINCCWSYKLPEISTIQLSDNVVTHLTSILEQLPDYTLEVLKAAAVIGNSFDLNSLIAISPSVCDDGIFNALQKGYIITLDREFVHGMCDVKTEINFQFSHDRILQAIYALLTESELTRFHRAIYEYIMSKEFISDVELLKAVEHLNKLSIEGITNEERARILLLNIKVANQVKEAAAYDSAKRFYGAACSLETPWLWDNYFKELIGTYNSLAEIALQQGLYKEMDSYLKISLEKCDDILDEVDAMEIAINSEIARNNHIRAIKLALNCLSRLGLNLSENPSDFELMRKIYVSKLRLAVKGKDNLINSVWVSDPVQLAILQIMNSIASASYLIRPKLFLIMAVIQVESLIKYGQSRFSACALSLYGMIHSGILGEYDAGYELGKLSVELSEQSKDGFLESHVLFHCANFLLGWHEPVDAAIKMGQDAYRSAIKHGDLEYAAWIAGFEFELKFFAGYELSEVCNGYKHADKVAEVYNQVKQRFICAYYIDISSILMRGKSDSKIDIDLPQHIEERKNDNDFVLVFLYYLLGAMKYLLHNSLSKANDCIDMALEYSKHDMSSFVIPALHFYNAIIKLELCRSLDKQSRGEFYSSAIKSFKKLKKFSEQCPLNFLHKYKIVNARIEYINGNKTICDLYSEAIALAEGRGATQDAALASELASRDMFDLGNDFFGYSFFKRAHALYSLWGAHAVAKRLHVAFPHIVIETGQMRKYSTVSSDRFVDSETLKKVSDLISNEENVIDFVGKMMTLVIENSGADRALLLKKDGDYLYVEVIASSEEPYSMVHEKLDRFREIPHKIVNDVITSNSTITIADTAKDSRYCTDKYVVESGVKSTLTLPLIHYGELAGVLYLENSVTSDVFRNVASLELLNLLTSQMIAVMVNDVLYKKVENRNIELLESTKRAEQYAIQAQSAEMVKGQFLSNLSHELRTPMNGIIGVTELLGKTKLDEVQAEYIKNLKITSDKFVKIIDKILDFATIDSGDISLKYGECNIKSLLNEVKYELQKGLGDRDVCISLEISNDTPCVVITDQYRLRQAMMCLVENAAKFTDCGTIEITSRVEHFEDSCCTLKFIVCDTGIGLGDVQKQEIFSAFTQQDASSTRTHGGLGVGLALMKHIVSKMDGDFGASNNVGEGATFWFTYKVKLPNKQDTEIVQDNKDVVNDTVTQDCPLRVLIVEDDVMNQMVLKKTIVDLGCEVEICGDGKKAVSLLEKTTFDIVFMDCQMPIMDGYMATEIIRSPDSAVIDHNVKIVALTANTMTGDKEKCINAGMDIYMKKPINFKELREFITQLTK